jgi:hypothetical protein
MIPYYDQPGWRQRGPEDVAGVLVLVDCAALGFCWYVAASRLHLPSAWKCSCTVPSCSSWAA